MEKRDKPSDLSPTAAVFKPRAPVPQGWMYEGTDEGAINREFFFVEGQTQAYRQVLPHGHIVLDPYGGISNISYTYRKSGKLGTVVTETHWNSIKADSTTIYNMMAGFCSGT